MGGGKTEKHGAPAIKIGLDDNDESERVGNITSVGNSRGMRVGIGTRVVKKVVKSHFIEVEITICPASCRIDLDDLRKRLDVLEMLRRAGFSMCAEDGLVFCELEVDGKAAFRECKKVLRLIGKVYGKRQRGQTSISGTGTGQSTA